MDGFARRCFCPDCQTDVHALEQYSAEEIEELRRGSPNRLCGYRAGESPAPQRSRRVVLLGALLTAISPLMAQSGRVRIRVTDATGAEVPNADVSLPGPDAHPQRKGYTNDMGEILLTDLPMGDLRVTVSKPGFQSLPLIVTVRNADEQKVEARLQVGTVGGPAFVEPVRQDALRDLPPGVIQPKRARKRWWIFR
jgi:hypothetical protein